MTTGPRTSTLPVVSEAAIAVAVLTFAACGHPSGDRDRGSNADTSANQWETLHRPFTAIKLRARQGCPVSAVHRRVADFANLLGDGPLYPAVGHDGTLRAVPASRGIYARIAPKDTLVQKTLWTAPPSFSGAALIRLVRLDRPTGTVRFHGHAGVLTRELRLSSEDGGSTSSGWRNWPTSTFISSPGCFAFRVDTARSHQMIVFRVVRQGTPPDR
jgi:hypothetical protein